MKTIKVRVAVAVNSNEQWSSSGAHNMPDEDAKSVALDGLDYIANSSSRHAEVIHWVEADVPVPEGAEVSGEVTGSEVVEP